MKERPILFSSDMVKSILLGEKTNTRRVVKCSSYVANEIGVKTAWETGGIICPYGKLGDRLWVRENWKLVNWQWEDPEQKIMYSDGSSKWVNPDLRWIDEQPFDAWLMREYERVTKHPTSKEVPDSKMDSGFRWEIDEHALPWRPGIFMPRWMSRINLTIKNIRVEQVQSISYVDCIAEGFKDIGAGDLRAMYANKWNALNAKRGFPWSSNPWVWVIEFGLTPSPSPTRGGE